jgi:hypothetical protein
MEARAAIIALPLGVLKAGPAAHRMAQLAPEEIKARAVGAEAPWRLAQPIDGTLSFAGEATDPEGRTGTVDSAIATGRRAARQVLRALRT